MSMVRNPVYLTNNPNHNLVPQAGQAIWYGVHDGAFLPGIAGLPDIVETVDAGTASGSKWSIPGFYQFPDANGGANEVSWKALDDVDDLYLNQVMSLIDLGIGNQLVIGLEASYDEAPTGNASLWCYGRNNSSLATMLCLDITSAEVPRVQRLGRNGATSTVTLTAGSGTFASLRTGNPFVCFLGISMISATNADLELRAGDGTNSCHYYSNNVDMSGGGTHLPGFSAASGMLMTDFRGLTLGGRNSSTGTTDANWGNGSASATGRLGLFQARRYTYSADRVAAKVAKQLTRPRDVVVED